MSPVTTPLASNLSDDDANLDLTRLPKGVVPKRYELKLDVYPEEKKYSGIVNIRVFFHAKVTNIIWLHAVRLTDLKASIRFSTFVQAVDALEIIPRPDKDCIGIRFENPIPEGDRAWLSVTFKGEINPHLEGFFSTPYVNKNGETRMGAATMFAATEARSCFPCFDEPEFKAVFALEVTVDSYLLTLSNMPVQDSVYKTVGEEKRKRRTDYFEWTKEMSSYLVCVVIGEYEFLETKAAGRTVVRAYTPWGQREQGRFALEVAKKSLEFFNDYFGKRYPLPKLDLVAVSRLSVGAMENWGIITCRESGMITDMSVPNPSSLQRISTLIAHEVSHMWFGNLVTMKWWDGLFLNEGFATLMQYICIDKLYPDFHVFNRFCTDTVIPALGLDALDHSHPIEMPLKDSSEISQVFDKITYCKGASVIYMLHQFIGEAAFKEAIQDYMEQFSYDNATTQDLWHFLGRKCEHDVASIMDAWITELGFPVVRISMQQNSSNEIVLQQERFSSLSHAHRPVMWSIPLTGVYVDVSGNLNSFEILFDKHVVDLKLRNFDSQNPKCWVKLNPKLTGFYRVQYGDNLFDLLLENLDSPDLTAIDRMALFDDQVAMVLSDGGSITRILKMVQLFRDFETSFTVWKSVCGILHQLRTLTWPTEDTANLFDQFCLDTLKPVLARIGQYPSPRESQDNTMLRTDLLCFLASVGDEATAAMAKDLFRLHIDEISHCEPSLRNPVFKSVMVSANQQTFQQMMMLYRASELAEERVSILGALGAAEDPNVLSSVLDFALSSEVHAQEALTVLVSVANNRYGYRQAWQFFVANIDKILDRYLGGLFLFSKLVKSLTECFCDQDSYREVADFFAANRGKLEGSEQVVEQSEEHIRLNVIWRDNDINPIQAFLDAYFNS